MARRSRNPCPTKLRHQRPKERSPNSASCKLCTRNLSKSTCRSVGCAQRNRTRGCGRKKTAEAICQEVTREVEQLLRITFGGRHKTGRLDLEAIEMVVRSAMHQAGAAAPILRSSVCVDYRCGWRRAK